MNSTVGNIGEMEAFVRAATRQSFSAAAREMGLTPFEHLLNDRRFSKIPMYLETPKGTEDGQDLDAMNLATLRSLLKTS